MATPDYSAGASWHAKPRLAVLVCSGVCSVAGACFRLFLWRAAWRCVVKRQRGLENTQQQLLDTSLAVRTSSDRFTTAVHVYGGSWASRQRTTPFACTCVSTTRTRGGDVAVCACACVECARGDQHKTSHF